MSAVPLRPGDVVDVLAVPLAHEPLPAADVQSGSPTTGAEALAALGGLELGVWEMSVGVACDTEVDELFVVLTGRAVVEFLEPFEGRELATIAVGPGSLVRLAAGMRTRWTVTETLRKVYVV